MSRHDEFIEELKEAFPGQYLWVDDACVVLTLSWLSEKLLKAKAKTLEERLYKISEKYHFLFREITSVNMPEPYHMQVTFYSKGVCPTCGRR